MKIRQHIKTILKNLKLLDFFYFLHSEVFSKSYFPMHISYKGYAFNMLGMHGDFHRSVELYGCYEPFMIDKAIEIIKPRDIIFDVGCAEGYFSIFASQLNKNPEKIYGFDCSEARSRIFKKNNRIALGGKANFIDTLISDHKNKDTITIDSFIKKENIKVVDVIKIDVEGAEFKVLKGMSECLKNFKPRLLIEIHPYYIVNVEGDSLKDLCNLIENKGYNIELCTNHRGEHRGRVEPWRDVTSKELFDYCTQSVSSKHNFAIHCFR